MFQRHRGIRVVALAVPVLVTLVAAPAARAERGDDSQRASKNGKTEGVAGGAGVVVEYGRPSVKARAIWGELVPFGKTWRAGADEATTVAFDRDVLVEGKPLAAGTYALFLQPAETGPWTVVFNKVAQQWGAYDYDANQDALRVEATPRAHEHVETLTYAVEGDQLLMRWEKLELPIAVRAAS